MAPATTETMFHLMVDINTQLMLAVDWANTLSPFAKLPTADQVRSATKLFHRKQRTWARV